MPAIPTKLGRYELITRIGQGGMAEVQLALQRGPAGFEKLVVVKLVHENLATQKTFVDMLLDEARVAALVKHPNVVDIYDLGEADGRYFIAMEYLEGEPLLSVLRAGREGKRLDVMSTARLVADAAEGLEAAHELRSIGGEALELVHHDVSLGNIVILYNGQVKLVDFGVAKATQTTASRNKVQGKFSYMAPEKMRGEPGDRRSDIFSLGCVLWESLTLKRLFRGGNDADTMKQVLESVIVPPSQMNPDVPDELDPIVMRALEREVEHRYATAAELAADLEEVLREHKYPRKNDAIAKYMNDTFKDHIAARKKLLQEVSSKGTASSEILDLAFAEPMIASGTPSAANGTPNDFSVKFKRTSQAIAAVNAPTGYDDMELALPRTNTFMRNDGLAMPRTNTFMRNPTPVPGLPVARAPITDVPADDGDPDGDPNAGKVTDMIGKLEHAGSQPLVDTDLAHGVSGQFQAVKPEDIGGIEGLEATGNTGRIPRTRTSAGMKAQRGETNADKSDKSDKSDVAAAPAPAVLPNAPETGRSKIAMIAVLVFIIAVVGVVVAMAVLGGGKSDEDSSDDRPVHVHEQALTPPAAPPPLTPPAAVIPDAGVPAAAVELDAAVPVDAALNPPAPDAAPIARPMLGSGEATVESLYRQGDQLTAKNDLPHALAALKKAQQMDPSFAPTWRALGALYFKMGDHAQTRSAYQKYLQLAPNAADGTQIRTLLEKL